MKYARFEHTMWVERSGNDIEVTVYTKVYEDRSVEILVTKDALGKALQLNPAEVTEAKDYASENVDFWNALDIEEDED